MNFNLDDGCDELIEGKGCFGGHLISTKILIADPVRACHDWCRSTSVNFDGYPCCEWHPESNSCGLWNGDSKSNQGFFSGVCKGKGER